MLYGFLIEMSVGVNLVMYKASVSAVTFGACNYGQTTWIRLVLRTTGTMA